MTKFLVCAAMAGTMALSFASVAKADMEHRMMRRSMHRHMEHRMMRHEMRRHMMHRMMRHRMHHHVM